jgi:LmbE family N-acetylglucosaminyl deacetylase
MRGTKIMIALAALALAPAAMAQEAPSEPQQVLAVFAHPDDELFMAPALAALAREGAKVTIFHATRGDAGPGVSDLPKGAMLAKRRSAEAWCAALALGASHAIAEHGDGTLADNPQGKDSSAKILADQLANRFPYVDLVLTWGPDGGYGHADHRMVSALTTQVVQAMPAAERPKLLYVGIPSGSLPPVPEMADWAVTDPALLTETIAYTPADLAAAKAAAMCHVTQFDEASRQGMMGLFDATMWRGKVHFRPAF